MLDSLDETDEHRLALFEMEMATFHVIKKDLVAEMGEWMGSLSQNKRADRLITNVIRGSLSQYESTRKHYELSYFSFM